MSCAYVLLLHDARDGDGPVRDLGDADHYHYKICDEANHMRRLHCKAFNAGSGAWAALARAVPAAADRALPPALARFVAFQAFSIAVSEKVGDEAVPNRRPRGRRRHDQPPYSSTTFRMSRTGTSTCAVSRSCVQEVTRRVLAE